MQSNGKSKSKEAVQFEKHQPERRRGAGGRVFCNGGCCCCSCCLHSLGGVIGATIGTLTSRRPSEIPVVICYWFVLVAFTAATAFFWGIGIGDPAGGLIVLLVLPLIQLAASLATLVWIGIRSVSPVEKKANLLALGKITLWSILGALTGLAAMIVGVKMFGT